MLHGFSQTRGCWGGLIGELGTDHDVVTLDAPGHGSAGDVHLDAWASARWLADEGGAGVYLGYSMGGRLALHVALAHPEVVERLVLVSATAGIEDPDDRAHRRAADEATAKRIEQDGVTAFLDDWLAQPMFAGLSPAAQWREARLANSARGLAASLRLSGTGAQDPLWDRLGEVSVPTLVVAGANDEKFVHIAERMDSQLPNSELAVMDDVGHSAHLESPTGFADLVLEWLRRTQS